MAKNVGNDKAIEYASVKEQTLNIYIANIESADVDCTDFRAEVEKIEKELQANIAKSGKAETLGGIQSMNVASIENAYQNAIKKLYDLQRELKEYDVYFQAKSAADGLSKTLENKEVLPKGAINQMGDIIVLWLEKLNSSGTRDYRGEQRITEYLYDIGYSIMILEVANCKKSKVLEWAKTSIVGHNMLSVRVRNQIDEEVSSNERLERLITELHTASMNPDYLTMGILKILADIDKVREADKIEARLKDIYAEMDKLKITLDEKVNEKSDIKDNIKEENRKRNRIFGGILSTFITFGIIAAWSNYADNLGHEWAMQEKFETTEEHYLEGYGYVDAPLVTEEFKMDGSANLYEFSPWEQNGNKYTRHITKYDVSEENLGSISEYANIDTTNLAGTDAGTETKLFLFPDDVYDEAIHYVERITQSDEAIPFEGSNSRQNAFVALAYFLGVLVMGAINGVLAFADLPNIFTVVDTVFHSDYDGKKRKEFAEKLKENLQSQKKLISENEEYKKEFMRLFQEYAPFIDDSEVIEKYQILNRKKDN